MANDGSVTFKIDADDKEAVKKLAQLEREISKTAAALEQTESKRNGIAEQLEEARAAAEKTAAEIRAIQEEMASNERVLSGQEGNIDLEEFNARKQAQGEMTLELAEQQKLYQQQNAEVAKLTSQYSGLTEKAHQQTTALERQKTEAGEVEQSISRQGTSVMPALKAATDQVSASLKKGFKNILRWGFGIRSMFILIRRLRSAISEGIKEYAKGDAETKANLDGLKASLASLKASWGAAFAPIVNAVAPLIQKLIGWLQTAAEYIQMFFSVMRGGTTFKRAITNTEALADGYKKAGGAAAKASKQIMGFDEINKLNEESGGGGGGSGDATQFEEVDINSKFQTIVQSIKDNLALIEMAVGGALLALGAILTFSGANIPLGLGLMAAGAIMLAQSVKADWSAVTPKIAEAVAAIMAILAVAMLAIGAMIAFSGANIPLGIALMIAGLAAGAAVVLNWDNLPKQVQRTVTLILQIMGAALLVIGAVLAFSGASLPLGLALMAAGGISLAVAAGLNWDTLVDKIKGAVEKVNGFMDRLKQKWEEVKQKVADMKQDVVDKFESLKEKVRGIIDKIKQFFSFQWQLPHIPLPHFAVSPPGWRIQNLFDGIIPRISVQWYAKGGIVDTPTLFGAGEAGKEAIIPLERNTEWINNVADTLIDRLANGRLGDLIEDSIPALLSGRIVPPLATAGGYGDSFASSVLAELKGLREEMAVLARQPIQVATQTTLDRRVLGSSVTTFQRDDSRRTGR